MLPLMYVCMYGQKFAVLSDSYIYDVILEHIFFKNQT
jgi:hypothetical protein